MNKMIFKDFNGDLYETGNLGERSALPHIDKRFEHLLPVETISTDRMRGIVAGLNIKCTRALTVDEANTLVLTIKKFIISEINKSEKFYVDRKGGKKGD